MRFLALIGFIVWAGASFGQIRISESVQDLGDIFENRGKVTAKFNLQNPYRTDTIRIIDIVSSCGCTAVLAEDTLILPQTNITLEVTYYPAGRLGLFLKSIELTTKTGRDERDKLYLKIMGNVVSESFVASNTNNELIEYSVAPIYFYPVTAYDASYLDYNFIVDFVNDLTYEIDFYQFSTIGVAVEVADIDEIEKIEHLIKFSQNKIYREFNRRGFKENSVFFEEPVFKKSTNLPPWAQASIRLYSVNFDSNGADTSVIKVSDSEAVLATKMLLEYQRFNLPDIDEIVAEVNFETIEGKLFLNGELDLRGTILMPWKKSDNVRKKTSDKLKKAILKRIKSTTGASQKQVRISFDSLGIHPEDKFQFLLWDKADEEEEETIRYRVKPDKIVPPLLPTYKQHYEGKRVIDTASQAFKHFWKNCLLSYKNGHSVKLLLQSSLSTKRHDIEMENIDLAWIGARALKSQLQSMFKNETGGGELDISIKGIVRGPNFELSNRVETCDYSQFDYFNIIPLIHQNKEKTNIKIKPYMVNFDYFYKGIDTGAHGFQVFADYLAEIVKRDGFVELRMESSISKIPIEETTSNLFLAYNRLVESEKRLKAAMELKLIDPNRIIFTDELAIIQGPEYDGTIPILKYREFHYIRIIPKQTLNPNGK